MRNVEVFDSCFEAYKRIWQTNGNVRSINPERVPGGGSSPQYLPGASDYLADFALSGLRALEGYPALVFVRHYVGMEDLELVRKAFAVSLQTFDAWCEQIRKRAGGAFRRGGLWPRKRYFRIHGASATARFLAEVDRNAEG
jgi:hypothetical protein